ncbi:MAG: VWA domain-containing protein [Treponemataceae bacterium]|nr:MAG: VWA domain-containing protein [Treponemataceae bacterium]
MSFDSPLYFLLFLLFPLYAYLQKIFVLQPPSVTFTLYDWDETHNAPLIQKSGKAAKKTFCEKCIFFLYGFARVLYALAVSCMFIALTQPNIKTEKKVYTGRGAAIIFVLDISPSMAASDIENAENRAQTRFDAARTAIKTIVQAHEGNSYGLALLAAEAALAVSVTEDSDFFLKMLDDVHLGELGESSAIGEGISVAVFHLAKLRAPKKCIILLTDGENNSGAIHPNTAAAVATRNGILFYVLGIGKTGSSAIEYTDTQSGKTVSGILDSQFNDKFLMELAESANGEYFSIHNAARLTESVQTISHNTTVLSQEYYMKRIVLPLSAYFVDAAILCIILGWFIRRIVLRESL